MAIDNVLLGEFIDPTTFGNQVVDRLNQFEFLAFGIGSGTTNAGGAVSFAHGLSWTPSVVLVSPISPNGATSADRWTGTGAVSVNSTNISIGRVVSSAGGAMTSTAVTFFYVALA